MRFSIITAILAGASVAIAVPTTLENRQQLPLCTGTDSNALCCSTDVLGVADLDCATPPTLPTDIPNFIDICAAIGQRARCCLLPVLGQALVCGAPA
ncbi:hypothetical protein GALMADRAFT_87834 [Galerina marginata CBS 339.88]|uniref:Hydrophobin n=1 Tax=Galerina marginata (strain CBS 339.88) TaxID=685588 RepID=A0A067TH33_GALM3|nr:hypothetical protein GALMADRAFT_87834 [Galerina marginata CBS 339.88]